MNECDNEKVIYIFITIQEVILSGFKFDPLESGLRKTLRDYHELALRFVWEVGRARAIYLINSPRYRYTERMSFERVSEQFETYMNKMKNL